MGSSSFYTWTDCTETMFPAFARTVVASLHTHRFDIMWWCCSTGDTIILLYILTYVLYQYVYMYKVLKGPGLLSRYCDSLRAGRSGDRIPVGVRYSAPIHTMVAGSFQRVKRPARGLNHSPPSSAEVEGRVELYLYCPFVSSWQIIVWNLNYLLWRLAYFITHFCNNQ